MIHGGLSTLFIIVIQVSGVCHQQDIFSPAGLYNPLLYVSFQYLYPRCLHLPEKINLLIIFYSFLFSLYDLQYSALHGLDFFISMQYLCVLQFAFYKGGMLLCIFETDLQLYCLMVKKGVFNTVEHVFNWVHVGAPRWDREFCCPDSLQGLLCCLAILARVTILQEQLCCGVNVLFECPRKLMKNEISKHLAPLCVLHIARKESLLVCKIWLP